MGLTDVIEVFFTADAVLHIDGEWPDLEVERTTQKVAGPNI